jgi:hypothetical protein
MKLPLKIGLPLLGLLLVGLALSEGAAKWPLLLAAMGVALWCAFSLPPPKRPPELRVIAPDDPDGAKPTGLDADGAPATHGPDEPPR